MGYFAITSDNSELVIKKTSETLFVRRKDSIVFFEIEIENIENLPENGEINIIIYFPRKLKDVRSGEKIVEDEKFFNWYYSQKKITQNKEQTFLINDTKSQIVFPVINSQYDKNNDLTKLSLTFNYRNIKKNKVKTLHSFFTFHFKNVISSFGSVFVESRFFDRKICPKGDYFDNIVLHDSVLEVKSIYNWFIAPHNHIAHDYTSYGIYLPRDARIIEKNYDLLLNNESFIFIIKNKIKDYLFGRPQVINWMVKDIKFFENYTKLGKWDEIRLFVAYSGIPFKSLFLYVASISSILGFVLYILAEIFGKK